MKQTRSNPRNVSLDCFRGLFAILVAAGHFYHIARIDDIIPVSFALSVDFFFVLSGFVLTNSITKEKVDGNTWFSTFTKKRIYRIFPLFIFAVLLEFIVRKIIENVDTIHTFEIFKTATLTQLFPFHDQHRTLLTTIIGWSLSAEFWAGLIFFSLIFIAKDKYKYILLPLLTILSILLIVLMSNHSPRFMDVHFQELNGVPYGFIRVIIGFSLGAIVAMIKERNISYLKASLIQIITISLILILYKKINYNRETEYIAPFLFAVMIYSLSLGTGAIYQAANNKIAEFLGKISYAIYLMHPVLIGIYRVMGWQTKGLPQILSYILILLVASYAAHIFIEKPFIKMAASRQKKNLSQNAS